ncbi:CurL C-terminal domain-containing protein, partial [Mycobacterium szulgai]|uniref:CurL C-terminal domain-containing protein n=2 Tax=Mycobacterium szulgai TaxID=1787 RepID=UPI0021F38D1B
MAVIGAQQCRVTRSGARLRQHLLEQPEVSLRDLAYSLATTRSHHPHRAAISTSSTSGADQARQNLLEALHALGHDQPHPGLAIHHLRTQPGAKTVFVLP